MHLQPVSQAYFETIITDQDTQNSRLDLIDPVSREIHTILDCPAKTVNCRQQILSGSLQEDGLLIAQNIHQRKFDGFGLTELYRLDTETLEAKLIDQFDGDIVGFKPIEGSSEGLMSLLKEGFRGELLIYNPDTLERHTLISRMGQFFPFGITPDQDLFYYRIADYCETELITRDGSRIPAIQNSDGILGWIDEATFLVFTA